MVMLTVLGSNERIDLAACAVEEWAGVELYRLADGRCLAPAFSGTAVVVTDGALPDPDDEAAASELLLTWVEEVRAHDWTPMRGVELRDAEGDWLELRTAMARIGWGYRGALAAWRACAERPYSRDLPTAAGWAGGGWVVPTSGTGDGATPPPAFARPVLEARGLLRWGYIDRWAAPVAVPDGPLPHDADPDDLGWADVLSRLRQDHYTEEARAEAEELAIELLALVGLGPETGLEAEDEPLPDRHLPAATGHDSALVRAAAWWLLRDEADEWLACAYGECSHHWAVEAEEDAYELEEVLELAGFGVANPVDAAYQRRRLLTLAFGDVSDVRLAGAGDVADFVDFYHGWVAGGRSEEEFADAAAALRADEDT